MFLKTLTLRNFRNIQDQTLRFGSGINVIWGQNGQGKTNIVEAIYLLGTTKSFRTSSLTDTVKFNHLEFDLTGIIETNIGEVELELKLQNDKKQAFINRNREGVLSNYIGRLITVVFSPLDLEIVREGPAVRRKLLDKHLVDLSPAMVDTLINLSRALRSKSIILKEGGTTSEIETWNQIIARDGIKVTEKRLELITELEAEMNKVFNQFAGSDGEIKLTYHGDFNKLSESSVNEKLNSMMYKEKLRGMPLIGPQRDDFTVDINGHEAKSFASQGQTRSIAIAVKLALLNILERRLGERPVVILDDVDSELDSGRSDRLFDFIRGSLGQIFITGTVIPKVVESCTEKAVLYIENGELKQS